MAKRSNTRGKKAGNGTGENRIRLNGLKTIDKSHL